MTTLMPLKEIAAALAYAGMFRNEEAKQHGKSGLELVEKHKAANPQKHYRRIAVFNINMGIAFCNAKNVESTPYLCSRKRWHLAILTSLKRKNF